MRIYEKIILAWNGVEYTLDESSSIWYDYTGDVATCCGATQQQTDMYNMQKSFYGTLQGQLGTVFGNSSTVFQDLVNTYSPIVAAGPNQQGFSPSELATLKSQAITGVGNAYQHAKEAVGEREAAFGGGNVYLPSGAQVGANIALANAAASQTSGELNQINLANWEQGRQNWLDAARGLAGAPNVFNPAVGFANAANQAGGYAAQTANQIAQENNSWISAVTGLAGSLGGAAMGAFGKGGGGGGGSIDQSGVDNSWAQYGGMGSGYAPPAYTGNQG